MLPGLHACQTSGRRDTLERIAHGDPDSSDVRRGGGAGRCSRVSGQVKVKAGKEEEANTSWIHVSAETYPARILVHKELKMDVTCIAMYSDAYPTYPGQSGWNTCDTYVLRTYLERIDDSVSRCCIGGVQCIGGVSGVYRGCCVVDDVSWMYLGCIVGETHDTSWIHVRYMNPGIDHTRYINTF